jgi:hypothetical protein
MSFQNNFNIKTIFKGKQKQLLMRQKYKFAEIAHKYFFVYYHHYHHQTKNI